MEQFGFQDPSLADEFLKKAQLARKTVEETLKVGVETESTIRWKKMLTDRANAKSSKPSSSSSVKSSRPKGKKRPVAKVQLKPKARPTKGQLAKNRHGGKRGVRVGEASHPGPTNLKVVTLNTQSSSNTWAFLHQVLTGSDIDVALLQEVSFNPSEAAAFSRYLRKKEFSFYYQKGSPNRRQGNGCSGGVGLLVRKTLPQRFAFADGDQEAQSLFVWVGGVLFGSIYAPPTEESPARAAAMFLDALISCNVQASATWCVGGDFNEVPSHSHFEDVAGAMHGSVCGLGAPTRWDGNREIDFFLVNRPDLASAVSSLALKLSDHKILQTQLAVSVQSPTTASLQKGPDLTKPTHVESEQWREVVEKAWEQTTQDIKGVASPFAECTVQEHWERIQALFRQTYQHAFRQVAVRHSEKKLALKGQNANVKWRSQAARGPRPENGHRKVRRKLARWYELRRFLMRDPSQLTAAQTIEFQNLLKKLDLAETGPPPLREVQARIDAISSLLGQAEKQAKESNIRQWRLRMQNVASLSRWLKSKQNPSHCVVTGTDNVVDGATAIFQFWHDFWRDLDAGRPAFADRVSTALAGIPQDLPALQWNCPNGVQLMATAQGCRGAAGADGWTADEIRYLPLDAFNLVANFFERCVAEGELPSQFFEARMVCIPKAAKITDYQIHVDQCRPITILSVFWRLWISTICKSPEMKNWIDAVIHPSINGLGGGDMYTTITRIFDQFDQDGYILGLDYCKAFDCLDPLVTKELLRRYGWPEPFISLCTRVWGDKSGSSLGAITPILTPFLPLLSLRVTPLVLSSCLFGSFRGFCPCSPKGRLFPPTWMIVVSLRCPLPSCANLCPGGRLGLLVWACLRALPKLWPLGAGLLSVLCCSPSFSRRWSRAGSVSLVRVPTHPPVVLPRLNLSVSLRRCNASLPWVALGSTFPTSLPTVACSPSPRLVSVGLRVPLPFMRPNGCSRLSGRTLGVFDSPIPGFGPCCWGGMSIWILLGSPGWLGVSSVALFGIAPVGLCVRARWRPVFMAGSSIGGGVLFGNGSGNTTSLLLLWISSPLGFCPPFFLAWRVWPSIIFVKDGEPGVFRSGPIQAGTKCNNSKKLPALSFAT